jgi:hypothetical protein
MSARHCGSACTETLQMFPLHRHPPNVKTPPKPDHSPSVIEHLTNQDELTAMEIVLKYPVILSPITNFPYKIVLLILSTKTRSLLPRYQYKIESPWLRENMWPCILLLPVKSKHREYNALHNISKLHRHYYHFLVRTNSSIKFCMVLSHCCFPSTF